MSKPPRWERTLCLFVAAFAQDVGHAQVVRYSGSESVSHQKHSSVSAHSCEIEGVTHGHFFQDRRPDSQLRTTRYYKINVAINEANTDTSRGF